MNRCKLWRQKLIGDDLDKKRHIWYEFIRGRNEITPRVLGVIQRDMPRTFPNQPCIQQHIKTIEKLIISYAAVNLGDSYLQGFNYIMSIVYYVFKDEEHAEPDSWWCFSRIVGLIRPLMPDFNCQWFHWLRNHWQEEFNNELRKTRPHIYSRLVNKLEEFSTIATVKWFMMWFSQNVEFDQICILWDYLIELPPSQLLKAYTKIALQILIDAAPDLSYRCQDNVNLLHAIFKVRINDMEQLLNNIK